MCKDNKYKEAYLQARKDMRKEKVKYRSYVGNKPKTMIELLEQRKLIIVPLI